MEQLKLTVDTDVINHLLFHKSLIDEKEDASRINYYVDVLEKTNEGEHVSMDNPFDRSIAIAFDLVMGHQLNPWNIDLVSFSTMYLKRAKEEKIDLMTAGRIIYMAWKILKLQSDDLVISMEKAEEALEQPFGWEDIPTAAWAENLDDYSYTNLLMKMPESPLNEPLRRKSERKVTLIELLDAFDQVRKESEEYQLLEEQRREERERIELLAREHMIGTAHEDHLEEDVMSVWKKIQKYHKKTMMLSELCGEKNREEFIKTLMSILFLAYDNKIIVYQQKFPYGNIFIKTIGYA